MEYIHYYNSPLGKITLASDGKALIGLWFDGQKYFGITLTKNHVRSFNFLSIPPAYPVRFPVVPITL